jgi:hypothetical protein
MSAQNIDDETLAAGCTGNGVCPFHQAIYTHPDGQSIELISVQQAEYGFVVQVIDEDDNVVRVPIGKDGLLALAEKLRSIALDTRTIPARA